MMKTLRQRKPLGLTALALGLALMAGSLPTLTANDHYGFKRYHRTGQNLVERLEADGRFGTLVFALNAAGLTQTVAEGGPFTLLAPTDEAFAAVPPETIDALLADPEGLLKTVLLYHVIDGRQTGYKMWRESTPTTLQGKPIVVTAEKSRLVINGGLTDETNVRASNGVIHVLQNVLLPPDDDFQINSIVDVLTLDGRFSTLLFAVDQAGLTSTLAEGGPFTLFAPTDEAFAAVDEDTLNAVLADPEGLLTDILLYHVLGEEQDAKDLLRNRHPQTLLGEDLSINYSSRMFRVNDAGILGYNLQAPNGVIHSIDSVLLPSMPEGNLLDLLKSDDRFSTLVIAIEAAGLSETVATGGPFTIMAPTNEAFGKLDPALLDALLADPENLLKPILLYHVIGDDVSSKDLSKTRSVETLQGDSLRVWSWWHGRLLYVDRSRVIDADLESSNGRVHAINRVLIPN